MKKEYQSNEWKEFRESVLDVDNYECVRCNRRAVEGAILQVHHLKYLPGKKPWQYPLESVETLCKRCHAVEHSKVEPNRDWTLIDIEDLGDLVGECEYCDNDIRYVHELYHPKWGHLNVGCNCAEKLTMDSLNANFRSRLIKFLDSTRWKKITTESQSIKLVKV
jgi:hypothetical protein